MVRKLKLDGLKHRIDFFHLPTPDGEANLSTYLDSNLMTDEMGNIIQGSPKRLIQIAIDNNLGIITSDLVSRALWATVQPSGDQILEKFGIKLRKIMEGGKMICTADMVYSGPEGTYFMRPAWSLVPNPVSGLRGQVLAPHYVSWKIPVSFGGGRGMDDVWFKRILAENKKYKAFIDFLHGKENSVEAYNMRFAGDSLIYGGHSKTGFYYIHRRTSGQGNRSEGLLDVVLVPEDKDYTDVRKCSSTILTSPTTSKIERARRDLNALTLERERFT
ncbi:MAG: hypothetical protein ABH817_00235 [archaeon]